MTRLNDILGGVYAPITITLDEKAHRFLAHLARIAGQETHEMARTLLVYSLTLEAEILTDCLTAEAAQPAHPSMQEMQPPAPDALTVEGGHLDLLQDELEEAARNHVNPDNNGQT